MYVFVPDRELDFLTDSHVKLDTDCIDTDCINAYCIDTDGIDTDCINTDCIDADCPTKNCINSLPAMVLHEGALLN